MPTKPESEAATSPPEETGERLATFERDGGNLELRLCRDHYEGHAYLSLRIWKRDQAGAFWPTRRGVSVRLSEAARLAELLAENAVSPRPIRFEQCTPAPPPREGPPPPKVTPPEWLTSAAARHTGSPVPMRGSPKQVAWATNLRQLRLLYCRRWYPELVALFSIIEDATWFIANAESSLTEVKWPIIGQTWQMPEPTAASTPVPVFDEFNSD
jgi:hypothetical protein